MTKQLKGFINTTEKKFYSNGLCQQCWRWSATGERLYLDMNVLFVIFLLYIVEIKTQATIRRKLCAKTENVFITTVSGWSIWIHLSVEKTICWIDKYRFSFLKCFGQFMFKSFLPDTLQPPTFSLRWIFDHHSSQDVLSLFSPPFYYDNETKVSQEKANMDFHFLCDSQALNENERCQEWKT